MHKHHTPLELGYFAPLLFLLALFAFAPKAHATLPVNSNPGCKIFYAPNGGAIDDVGIFHSDGQMESAFGMFWRVNIPNGWARMWPGQAAEVCGYGLRIWTVSWPTIGGTPIVPQPGSIDYLMRREIVQQNIRTYDECALMVFNLGISGSICLNYFSHNTINNVNLITNSSGIEEAREFYITHLGHAGRVQLTRDLIANMQSSQCNNNPTAASALASIQTWLFWMDWYEGQLQNPSPWNKNLQAAYELKKQQTNQIFAAISAASPVFFNAADAQTAADDAFWNWVKLLDQNEAGRDVYAYDFSQHPELGIDDDIDAFGEELQKNLEKLGDYLQDAQNTPPFPTAVADPNNFASLLRLTMAIQDACNHRGYIERIEDQAATLATLVSDGEAEIQAMVEASLTPTNTLIANLSADIYAHHGMVRSEEVIPSDGFNAGHISSSILHIVRAGLLDETLIPSHFAQIDIVDVNYNHLKTFHGGGNQYLIIRLFDNSKIQELEALAQPSTWKEFDLKIDQLFGGQFLSNDAHLISVNGVTATALYQSLTSPRNTNILSFYRQIWRNHANVSAHYDIHLMPIDEHFICHAEQDTVAYVTMQIARPAKISVTNATNNSGRSTRMLFRPLDKVSINLPCAPSMGAIPLVKTYPNIVSTIEHEAHHYLQTVAAHNIVASLQSVPSRSLEILAFLPDSMDDFTGDNLAKEFLTWHNETYAYVKQLSSPSYANTTAEYKVAMSTRCLLGLKYSCTVMSINRSMFAPYTIDLRRAWWATPQNITTEGTVITDTQIRNIFYP